MPIDEKTLLKLILGDVVEVNDSPNPKEEDKKKKTYTLTDLLNDVNEIDAITTDDIPDDLKESLEQTVKDELTYEDIRDQFEDEIDDDVKDRISEMEDEDLWDKLSDDGKKELAISEVEEMKDEEFAQEFEPKMQKAIDLKMDEKGKQIKEAMKSVFEKLKSSFPNVFNEIMTDLTKPEDKKE